MKNLVKNLSFLIAIFSAIILPFSFFAEKEAIANPPVPLTPTPRPLTPTPPPSFAQLGELCSPGRTECATGLTCINIDTNGYGKCAVPPPPTPTTSACAGTCGTSVCAICPNTGSFLCGTTDISQCSDLITPIPTNTPTPSPTTAPAATFRWQAIVVCPAPTPTPTSAPLNSCWATSQADWNTYCVGPINLQDLCTESGQVKCIDSKQRILCCKPPLLTPTPTPAPISPTSTPTPTQIPLDSCSKLNRSLYKCASSCDSLGEGWKEQATWADISCPNNQQCCYYQPTPVPANIPTPSPTPLPGSIQLAMNISAPGMIGKQIGENNNPILRKNRPVTVILKGSSPQSIDKSGTLNYSQETGSYTGTVDLGTSVPSGAYKVTVKMGNHLKGFVSNLSISTTTSTISLPLNASLVVGVDDDENLSPILYYNTLHSCFGTTIGKSKCSNPQEADLNSDGAVDGVDFNIFIRTLKKIVGI